MICKELETCSGCTDCGVSSLLSFGRGCCACSYVRQEEGYLDVGSWERLGGRELAAAPKVIPAPGTQGSGESAVGERR